MTTRTIDRSFWQVLRETLAGGKGAIPRWQCYRRVIVSEAEAYTLPREVREVRVVNGGAWVSYLREDVIVPTGETLSLPAARDNVVVTATGHQPVELELYL